ncbi:hypothetical protein LXL04_031736 [Taraxacum kok-saghyz]
MGFGVELEMPLEGNIDSAPRERERLDLASKAKRVVMWCDVCQTVKNIPVEAPTASNQSSQAPVVRRRSNYTIPRTTPHFGIGGDYFLRKLQNLPPRPWLPPLPIIGHLYLLKRPVHKSLAKISAKYGPVQLLQLGSRRVLLLISSPSAAEECLTKNDITFANRPKFLAGKYLGYNYDSLVYAPYGDHWRNLRRVTTLEILSTHRLREFEPIRADEVRLMIQKLYRSWSGKGNGNRKAVEVQVNAMLVDLTINAVMRMVSGKRYYYGKDDILTEVEKEKARRFQEIVAEVFCAMSATHVGDYLPVLRWLGVSKLEKQLIDLQAKRDLFMQELVEEIRCGMKNSFEGNTVGLYMEN